MWAHCALFVAYTPDLSLRKQRRGVGVGLSSFREQSLCSACIFSLTAGAEPHLQILAKCT